MEAVLYKITLWSFFAAMISHFVGVVPEERSRSAKTFMLLAYLFVLAGFVSLTTILASRWISQNRVPISSSYEYLSVLAWCVSITYFLVMYKLRSAFIGACLSPGLFLAIVFAGLYPRSLEMTLVPALQSYWLQIHVTLTIVGEAAFALAFVAGILYLVKNCNWQELGPAVKRKSLLYLVFALAAGLALVQVLRIAGVVLEGLSGWKAFVVMLGGGFLIAVPVFIILWRKGIGENTANFGGLLFALSILSLLISGMSLGSYQNRHQQEMDKLVQNVQAVDELSGLLDTPEGKLAPEKWQEYLQSRNQRLGLIASLEELQAKMKRSVTREDAAVLLAGSDLLSELTFPLSLGEIRQERHNLAQDIQNLEQITGMTGLPVAGTALHMLRSRMIDNYNRLSAADLLPQESGREGAFLGYMVLFAVPLFIILYYLARAVQGKIPELETLDTLAYRTVSLGFPIFTFGALISGAIWAHYAWGKWWSNDPKEMGSLIVWLTFLIYLHARYVRRWSGNQAAVAAILGFLFAMLSFVGNSVLSGLHAYG